MSGNLEQLVQRMQSYHSLNLIQSKRIYFHQTPKASAKFQACHFALYSWTIKFRPLSDITEVVLNSLTADSKTWRLNSRWRHVKTGLPLAERLPYNKWESWIHINIHKSLESKSMKSNVITKSDQRNNQFSDVVTNQWPLSVLPTWSQHNHSKVRRRTSKYIFFQLQPYIPRAFHD